MPKDEQTLGTKIKQAVGVAEHKTEQLKHNARAEGHDAAAENTSGFASLGHRLDEAKEKMQSDSHRSAADKDLNDLND